LHVSRHEQVFDRKNENYAIKCEGCKIIFSKYSKDCYFNLTCTTKCAHELILKEHAGFGWVFILLVNSGIQIDTNKYKLVYLQTGELFCSTQIYPTVQAPKVSSYT